MRVIVSKIIDSKTFKATATFLKKQPLYQKYIRVSKTYLVDSSNFDIKIGQSVEIVNSRPISKNKKWTIKTK